MIYLATVRVLGLEIVKDKLLIGGQTDCWIARGQDVDGGRLQVYLDKKSGLVVAEVIEDGDYTVVKRLFRRE